MDFVRIRWVFDDSVVDGPEMARHHAERDIGEVGYYGLTVNPRTGVIGDGEYPKRSIIVAAA